MDNVTNLKRSFCAGAILDEVLTDPEHMKTEMTPKAELQLLKSMSGGWQLAERLLCPWLHQNMRIYYYLTTSSWSWYTDRKKVR